MSSREEILQRVRDNQPAALPLPAIPMFDAGLSTSIDTFRASLIRMGGKFVDVPTGGNLDAVIRETLRVQASGIVLAECLQNEARDRRDLHDE